MAVVTITMRPEGVRGLVKEFGEGPLRKAATITAKRAQIYLLQEGRVRTGALHESIKARPAQPRNGMPVWEVGSLLPYAIYQEFGIGPVVARKGKVLRFTPKGGGIAIYRPRSRGFRGARFMERAFYALRSEDFVP